MRTQSLFVFFSFGIVPVCDSVCFSITESETQAPVPSYSHEKRPRNARAWCEVKDRGRSRRPPEHSRRRRHRDGVRRHIDRQQPDLRLASRRTQAYRRRVAPHQNEEPRRKDKAGEHDLEEVARHRAERSQST